MGWVQSASSLLIGLSCCLVSAAGQDGPSLTMFVYTAVGKDTLIKAEAASSRILQCAGVQLIWRNCGPDDRCQPAPDSEPVLLRIVKETRGGLGCSLVSQAGGIHAVIGFENIRKLAALSRISESQVLGAVMAHKVGHLLLGPAHSTNGLMRSNWDVHDLCRLDQGQLRFDLDQCRRIRAAALARSRCDRSIGKTTALSPSQLG
ncbi:MAG: hypothetical protein WAM39_01100 [Bryobacteraceae bacterium]